MIGLYQILAVSDHCPEGTCWAWMDSAERVCGKPEAVEHLCQRHELVALARIEKRRQKLAEQAERRRERAVRNLGANRAKLANLLTDLERIERRMNQLDPPPPTTDPAAWGGVGNSASARYRKRVTDDRVISEMVELYKRRDWVQARMRSVRAEIELAES